MERNNIIIIALIAIIIALLVVGAVTIMPDLNKHDTKLIFKNNSTITEGDSIKIKLTDDNGTALVNQAVNVTITDENKSSDYHSVVTDEKGVGTLEIDKSAGNYSIMVMYGGNENYSGCNATQKITIEEEVVEEPVIQQTQSSSSSNNNGLHYDEEVNVYYDDNGIVVDPDGQHSQGVGMSYSDIRDARDRWERGEPVMV